MNAENRYDTPLAADTWFSLPETEVVVAGLPDVVGVVTVDVVNVDVVYVDVVEVVTVLLVVVEAAASALQLEIVVVAVTTFPLF